jgi:hypothetical protein
MWLSGEYQGIGKRRADNALGRVKDAGVLEDLCDDRDGRVDGVSDDEDLCLGRDLCSGLGQVADDGGVGLFAMSVSD